MVLFDLKLLAILCVVELLAFVLFVWRNYEVLPFEPQQATPSAALNHAMIFGVFEAAVFALFVPGVYALAMLYRNRRFLF